MLTESQIEALLAAHLEGDAQAMSALHDGLIENGEPGAAKVLRALPDLAAKLVKENLCLVVSTNKHRFYPGDSADHIDATDLCINVYWDRDQVYSESIRIHEEGHP